MFGAFVLPGKEKGPSGNPALWRMLTAQVCLAGSHQAVGNPDAEAIGSEAMAGPAQAGCRGQNLILVVAANGKPAREAIVTDNAGGVGEIAPASVDRNRVVDPDATEQKFGTDRQVVELENAVLNAAQVVGLRLTAGAAPVQPSRLALDAQLGCNVEVAENADTVEPRMGGEIGIEVGEFSADPER